MAFDWLDLQEQTHTFADRLRGYMRDNGMSGRDLAVRAEISPSMVTRLCKGERRPSLGVLSRIANVFGITAADLWGG